MKSQNAPPGYSLFVARINFIQVQGNLGRGERIADDLFITNDVDRIRKLIDPGLRVGIGAMEYNNLIQAPLLAYSYVSHLQSGNEPYDLVEQLMILDTFENIFWLYSDCCVGHELGFLARGNRTWSNLYEGIRCRSDASQAGITISADRFRDLIRTYRVLLKPSLPREASAKPEHDKGPDGRSSTSNIAPDLTSKTQFSVQNVFSKTNSNRISRTLNFVGRAQKTSFLQEKIAFYCSALEALLSTSQQELSHQIAERVVVIAAIEASDRYEEYRFIKGCYSLRSKYVHGSHLSPTEEKNIADTTKRLDDIVRMTFYAISNDSGLLTAILDDKTLDEVILRRLFSLSSVPTAVTNPHQEKPSE